MRILIQRVKKADVSVDGKCIGHIGQGILAFVGFAADDNIHTLKPMAEKMIGLRIFEDSDEKMNLSLSDINGELLIVSQFTLYAGCAKGRRPSFSNAMNPAGAENMYNEFVLISQELCGAPIQTGSFGADMKVELLNDGPVTIMLDSDEIVKK